MLVRTHGRTVEVLEADLLRQDVDAIVNAANSHLAHGGGVARAIADAAGEQLQRESEDHPPVPVGQVGLTGAGFLPQPWVIHAVGPRWHGGDNGEPALLASAHRAAVARADALGLRSIALPAISCGIFGYPVELAAPVAVGAVLHAVEHAQHVERVRFCLRDSGHLPAFEAALRDHAAARGLDVI